ncbi:MAG TPA: uroporphyrinogen-III synthase [Vicinamibacterales bacterium]|nr:uroporphyrinogen-III synthase [Vicinamibacterales bacterium]
MSVVHVPNFGGLRVLTFESRRASELASLISTYGGKPMLAPALREVPLESNVEALEFAAALVRGEFDMTIFLTGAGTRTLADAVAPQYPRAVLSDALRRTRVVARGPKPLAALRELQVPAWASAPEPNTWREVIASIDQKFDGPLTRVRVAVQEYGVSNPELLDALRARGAHVTRVPVYRWALPDNLEPLRHAVLAIAEERVDVVLFTTGVQLVHFWQIVEEMQREADVRRGLQRAIVASIGPTTSEELHRHNLIPDFEPSHPKLGALVREAAERSACLR